MADTDARKGIQLGLQESQRAPDVLQVTKDNQGNLQDKGDGTHPNNTPISLVDATSQPCWQRNK